MYTIAEGSTRNLKDVELFVGMLDALDRHPLPEARGFFDKSRDVFIARAPGRLDVMGGIADYSGSLVLQLPLEEATLVALQRTVERTLRIVSLREGGSGARASEFTMGLAEFEASATNYEAARALFRHDSENHWAAYVAGAFLVLGRERGMKFEEGARILVSSDVPEGKGVSSSAAIEVATMRAVAAAFGVSLNARETALLSQRVENLVAGAPCGVMDQMTSACGERGRLLALLCQPAELRGHVSIPADVSFWGIDSGIRHSVSGADYTSVRVGAFMGYRIIAELSGLKQSVDAGNVDAANGASGAPVHIEDARWHGYLANLSPSEFEERYAAHLPKTMSGAEFLSRYAGTTDAVTRIEPQRNYAVRQPARHPVHEHFRVRLFAELLKDAPQREEFELLGELMYQSHASYSACGLGSDGTNLLVRLVREAGAARGLYGAKITGGGGGGTVAVFGRRDADEAVREVAETYERETGRRAQVFSGSSPGAADFGELRLSWQD